MNNITGIVYIFGMLTAVAVVLILTTATTKQKQIEYKHKNIKALRCLDSYPKLPGKSKKRKR